jgi:hypothetical protein
MGTPSRFVKKVKKAFKILGPGLITGASDEQFIVNRERR